MVTVGRALTVRYLFATIATVRQYFFGNLPFKISILIDMVVEKILDQLLFFDPVSLYH